MMTIGGIVIVLLVLIAAMCGMIAAIYYRD